MKSFLLTILLLVGSWTCYEANEYFLQKAAWNLGLFPNLCPQTVVETIVIQTTARKTCANRPTTALPACTNARTTRTYAIYTPRESAIEDEFNIQRTYWRPAPQNRFLFGYMPLLTTAALGFNKCTVTTTTTLVPSVTDTILGSFTCSDTAAGRLLPDYPFCDGVSEITCGYVPPGRLTTCPTRKRSLEFPEEFGPSDVHRIEVTKLPWLVVDYGVQVTNPEIRLDTSFQDSHRELSSVQRIYSNNAMHYGRAGAEKRAFYTTKTLPYTCYNELANFPLIPPCSPIEVLIQPDCTVIRDASGSISSPDDGTGVYPNDYNGCWVIVAPPGKQITITVTALDLELYVDFLVIYEGVNPARATTYTALTGRNGGVVTLPYSYTSQRNGLTLRFTTDYNRAFTGFKLTYQVAL